MPSRVIRGDDLRESERFMSQSPDVQILYILCMTVADDFGIFLATCTFLRRTLYLRPPSDAVIERRLRTAIDADLIRIFHCDGVRYGFIPRFQQRMDKYRSRHPMPPSRLYSDDEHAKEKFSKYKDKFKKMAPDGGEAAPVGGEMVPEVKGSEGISIPKGRGLEVKGSGEPFAGNPESPVASIAEGPIDRKKGNGGKTLDEHAKELGIERLSGEGDERLLRRILDTRAAREAANG